MPSPVRAVSIEGRNSLHFIETVFNCYDSGTLFCITRGDVDPTRIPGLEITATQPTTAGGGWTHRPHQPRRSDDPAQIVFSSGTEGLPKAVVLSHHALADVVARLNSAMAVTPEIREYVGVPVTYSFGLGRARAVAAAGGRFFLPDRFDPGEIRDMLEAGEINAISAVPSLWRLILASPGVIGTHGARVRWIEIGSQYMSGPEKQAMRDLFPNAKILQHYGLTEASRSTFLDISAGMALESVGTPTGDIELRIGHEGRIAIRGPHVALGLLGPGGGIRPVTDHDGWHQTSDRGEIRDGYLYYLGRLDDQINVAGVKLAAEGIEREIAELINCPGDFAIAPIPDPLRGEAVLLALGPDASELRPLLEAAAQTVLRRHGIQQQGLLQVFPVEELPVTGSGKVQRRVLREQWIAQEAQRQAPPPPDGDPPLTSSAPLEGVAADIAAAWSQKRGAVTGSTAHLHITPQTSFYDLGADSLSALQVGLAMEEHFSRATIRATMEGQTLAHVAAIEEAARQGPGEPPLHPVPHQAAARPALPVATRKAWALNITRGLMVISVISSHWAPGVFARLDLQAQSEAILAFFYRMGTPGFATVFGLGLGYWMLPAYAEQGEAVRKRLRTSLILVLIALLLAALTRITLVLMDPDGTTGGVLTQRAFATSFFNVLAFYSIALIIAPLWLGWLSRRPQPTTPILIGAALMWLIWRLAQATLDGPPLESVLEFLRLMSVAQYSFFRVSAFVCVGMAIGLWLFRQTDIRHTARLLVGAGLVGTFVAVVIAFESYGATAFSGRMAPFFFDMDGALFFVAFVTLVLGLALQGTDRWSLLSRPLRGLLQGLILTGGLALPLYAFQGLVLPIKEILQEVGLIENLAIALPVLAFVLAATYAFRRLGKIYFG